VKEVIVGMLLWPKRITVPILGTGGVLTDILQHPPMPDVDLEVERLNGRQQGVVKVTVLSAKDLKSYDALTGKSDPFVEVFTTNDHRCRTRVAKRTLSPQWGETFYLPVLEKDQVRDLGVEMGGGLRRRVVSGGVRFALLIFASLSTFCFVFVLSPPRDDAAKAGGTQRPRRGKPPGKLANTNASANANAKKTRAKRKRKRKRTDQPTNQPDKTKWQQQHQHQTQVLACELFDHDDVNLAAAAASGLKIWQAPGKVVDAREFMGRAAVPLAPFIAEEGLEDERWFALGKQDWTNIMVRFFGVFLAFFWRLFGVCFCFLFFDGSSFLPASTAACARARQEERD